MNFQREDILPAQVTCPYFNLLDLFCQILPHNQDRAQISETS